jgi:hypothetical protein
MHLAADSEEGRAEDRKAARGCVRISLDSNPSDLKL